MENEEDRKQKKTEKTSSHARWVIRVFLIAVALSAAMSLCSGALLEDAGYVVATLILLLFIALGILFDIIGVAVTAANPKPFNSMAAHRVKGAKEALYLIRNAEKVASFCNDVVGDICGIVSGSTATVIVVLLQNSSAAQHRRIHRGHGAHFRIDDRRQGHRQKDRHEKEQGCHLPDGEGAVGAASCQIKKETVLILETIHDPGTSKP